jgi:hypothetical protein
MAMATRGRIACEGAVSFVLLCLTVVCSFDDTTCLLASTAFGIILVIAIPPPQIYPLSHGPSRLSNTCSAKAV